MLGFNSSLVITNSGHCSLEVTDLPTQLRNIAKYYKIGSPKSKLDNLKVKYRMNRRPDICTRNGQMTGFYEETAAVFLRPNHFMCVCLRGTINT